jgi:thioredoxin 1
MVDLPQENNFTRIHKKKKTELYIRKGIKYMQGTEQSLIRSIKNESELRNLVKSAGVPVLVDFWAPWCGPCRMIAPMLEQIAGDLNNRAVIAKVNVDDAPDLAQEFKIQSIPTLVYYDSKGSMHHRTAGVDSKANITQWLTTL